MLSADPPETIECGVISGVYATVDFGERGLLLADEYFKIQNDANKKSEHSLQTSAEAAIWSPRMRFIDYSYALVLWPFLAVVL